ncbi:phage tail tube protein [Streptomyces sp. NPDC017936]|uniref:phage tail tube protein n=1 Tax=Streptomyces sp. NPDC017936 TaxID=3365016 RepID=UPI0037A09BDE
MAGEDAFGTQLKRESGAGTFQLIANVSDLSGPERSREAIEVTAHDSPNRYREFVKGLKDGGEVTATINYRPSETTHQALDADFEEDDLRNYQLVLLPDDPDEHTWDFTALITGISDAFPIDDKMEREVTFKISGKPTLTATGV